MGGEVTLDARALIDIIDGMNDHTRVRTLLGGLGAQRFLRRHWQKMPLLVRGALAGFPGLLSPAQLMKLACRDDVRARLVIRHGSEWEVHEGPLTAARLRKLPARGWSVLVHDVNLVDTRARALLDLFDFIPFARLDDLMVSYAPAGGGVGPHFDSYDVFLLQGPGRRRWRVSHQTDLSLRENAPLKLLRAFRSQGEAVLQAGDMLYVPPGWAHDGVAVEACMTYSIGFRAPQWHELGVNFLRYLEDRLQLAGLYTDPDLKTQRTPAQIAPSMLQQVARHIAEIRWSAKDVTAFLGQYLTEPKTHVFFAASGTSLHSRGF